MDNCKRCAYALKSETELHQYTCRRFPPQVGPVLVPGPSGQPAIATHCAQPTVTELAWCGEFESLPYSPSQI